MRVRAGGKSPCEVPQTIVMLFVADFMVVKAEQVYSRKLTKYRSLLNQINEYKLDDLVANDSDYQRR